MDKRPRALVLLGPTASGKTSLALALSKKFPCEIISLDSALVYQNMDIGTAKPNQSERDAVPHHLIDIISPIQTYSAADFVTDCVKLTKAIHQRGHIPLIVGGTMMYFHALTQGLNELPQADASIRAYLQEQKEQYGLAHLYHQLANIDPITANRLEANDSQRIERALEIFMLTGKSLSTHFQNQTTVAPLNLHSIALIPQERQHLHHQISNRFHNMLSNGFLEELRQLQYNYPELTPDLPSMRCVGYRQGWQHLSGHITYDEFVEQSIIATRQLAKRQLTWLRKLGANTIIDPHQHNVDENLYTVIKILESFFK